MTVVVGEGRVVCDGLKSFLGTVHAGLDADGDTVVAMIATSVLLKLKPTPQAFDAEGARSAKAAPAIAI